MFLFFFINIVLNIGEFLVFDFRFRNEIFDIYDSRLSVIEFVENNMMSYNFLLDNYYLHSCKNLHISQVFNQFSNIQFHHLDRKNVYN